MSASRRVRRRKTVEKLVCEALESRKLLAVNVFDLDGTWTRGLSTPGNLSGSLSVDTDTGRVAELNILRTGGIQEGTGVITTVGGRPFLSGGTPLPNATYDTGSIITQGVDGNNYSIQTAVRGNYLMVATWGIPSGQIEAFTGGPVSFSFTTGEAFASSNPGSGTLSLRPASNESPTLDAISDVNINEDASEQTVNLAGITAGGGETQPLRVTATSGNTGLIPDPTVDFDGQSSTGTLKFTPVADQFGTATITVTVEDGGLDNDLGTPDDNGVINRTVTVITEAVNDAPVLDPAASPQLSAVLEDAGAPVGPVGTLVSALIDAGGTHDNFSDIDGDLPGIAITETNLQGGTLWCSTDDGVTWEEIDDASEQSPQLLRADSETRLYFQPASDFSGSITDIITIRAWDRTGGWQQLGQTVAGESSQERYGSLVRLSGDGKTYIATSRPPQESVPSVSVFTLEGSTFVPLGNPIFGNDYLGNFGGAISISHDGRTIAIGANGAANNTGRVLVYRWIGDQWTQIGNDLTGEAERDDFGNEVSISDDGKTVAISAQGSNGSTGTGYDWGRVQVYTWNGTSWVQLGENIDGMSSQEYFGGVISLSGDGSVVAVRSKTAGASSSYQAHHLRMFRWSGSEWLQLGQQIDGYDGDRIGMYSGLSISENGMTLAVNVLGNSYNELNSTIPGSVRVYSFNSETETWQQRGTDVVGREAREQFGHSVVISADGNRFLASAPFGNNNTGRAAVYEWNELTLEWSEVGSGITGLTSGDSIGRDTVGMDDSGTTIVLGSRLHSPDSINSEAGIVQAYQYIQSYPNVSESTDTVSVTVTPLTPDNTPIPLNWNAPQANSLSGSVSVADLIKHHDNSVSFAGMAVTGFDSSLGTLFYTTDGGAAWQPVTNATTDAALLLAQDATTHLYMQLDSNLNDELTPETIRDDVLTYKPWIDQNSFSNGQSEVNTGLLTSDNMVTLGSFGDYSVRMSREIAISSSGEFAIVAGQNYSFKIVDIADPANLSVVQTISRSTKAYDVTISPDDSLAFLLDGDVHNIYNPSHLRIFDISDLQNPVELGAISFDKSSYEVVIHPDGQTAYVIMQDGIKVVDFSNPVSPVEIGTVSLNNTSSTTSSIVMHPSHETFYVAEWDELFCYSLENPQTPVLRKTLSVGAGIGRSLAMSSDGTRLLWTGEDSPAPYEARLIDTSSPHDPTLLGVTRSLNNVSSDAVFFDTDAVALVTQGGDGTRVIDYSDENSLIITSTRIPQGVEGGHSAIALTPNGDVAIIAAGQGMRSVRIAAAGFIHTGSYVCGVVADSNSQPTDITLSNSAVGENSQGAIVGQLTTTDPDVGDTFTYTLVPGSGDTDNSLFYIEGDSFRVGTNLDYETSTTANVRIRTTDSHGEYFEKAFIIGVQNYNEPPTDIVLSSSSIEENQLVGSVVGTLTSADPDGNGFGGFAESFTYSLASGTGDTNNSSFDIFEDELRTKESFNFEIKDSYSVRIRTEDNMGVPYEKQFVINVENVNDSPTGDVTIIGIATEDEVLAVDTSTFADEDGLGGIAYQWKRGGVAIDGATDSTYTLIQADIGTSITVTASYLDQGGTNESVTSAGTQVVTAKESFSYVEVGRANQPGIGNIRDFNGTTIASHQESGSGTVHLVQLAPDGTISAIESISGGGSQDRAGFGYSVTLQNSLVGIGSPVTSSGGLHSGQFYTYDLSTSGLLQSLNPAPHTAQYFGEFSTGHDGYFSVGEGGNSGWNTESGFTVYAIDADSKTVSQLIREDFVSAGDGYSHLNGLSAARDHIFGLYRLEAESEYVLFARAIIRNENNDVTQVGPAVELRWPISDSTYTPTNSGRNYYVSSSPKAFEVSNNSILALGQANSAADNDAGVVKLLRITNGAFEHFATLAPPSVEAGMSFGRSLAWAGTKLFVSAPQATTTSSGTGAVYVYDIANPDSIAAPRVITSDNLAPSEVLGEIIAANGDSLVASVGANSLVSFTVNHGPQAPVLDSSASPQLSAVDENIGFPVGQVGTLVSGLIDSGGMHNNFSDVDGDQPGIAITDVNLQGGTLHYSIDNGATWSDVGAVSEASPRLLLADGTTRLYFEPANEFNGSISDVVTIRAWDRNAVWTQLGIDIDGEGAGDRANVVSLSNKGNTLAIGAPHNAGNGTESGNVRIFEWDAGASIWNQRGDSIYGDAAGDKAHAVSLSGDGQIIAVGSPESSQNGDQSGHVGVYYWNNDTSSWVRRGNDIVGEAPGDKFGRKVVLSDDGNTLATSSMHNSESRGHVRIYSWDDSLNSWVQRGNDIDGERGGDRFGYSISLSSNGETLAVGAIDNSDAAQYAGSVRVYDWSHENTSWTQRGADLDGDDFRDHLGWSVSLSDDGNILAAGSIEWTAGAGYVRVYRWNEGTASWLQRGADVSGENFGDVAGIVAISGNGNRLVMGADGNSGSRGHVRIFDWNSQTSSWQQTGDDLDGEQTGDCFGHLVAISQSGNTVASGAYLNDGGGIDAGHVRVFQLSPSANSLSLNSDTVSIEVMPDNYAPVLGELSGVNINEGDPEQTVNLTGIAAGGGATQVLSVTATSDNTGLIPNPTVTYSSADSTGTLTFTPVSSQHGVASITVTVEDGGLDNNLLTSEDNETVQQMFQVTVLEVISNTNSVILAKDGSDSLYVSTQHVKVQPVTYQGQQVPQSFFQFSAVGADASTAQNALMFKSLGSERDGPTHRVLTDDQWRISDLFNSLHNEESTVLHYADRQVSVPLNIVAVAGAYEINGVNNPTLIVQRGQSYVINLNVEDHPFFLQTTGNGFNRSTIYRNFYGNGQTKGEYRLVIRDDAPDELFYQCKFHQLMFGKIIVID